MDFENAFRQIRRDVYPYFVHLSKDPLHAEDILQSALIKCWQLWPNKNAIELRRLTLVIGKRLFLNDCDKKRNERNRLCAWRLYQQSKKTADFTLEKQELCERIREALRRLPCQWSEVLNRAYYSDQNDLSIAKAMGKPLTTIKNWKRRALRHLRRILKWYES